MPAPSLSISSSISTGLRVPALRSAWMMLPGSAPTYVRRWPRISASSCTPPRLVRTNFRPSARAMLCPSEVLPTPGRSDEAQDRAAPLRVELAHREELEDALLDLVEPVVILVEDTTRVRDVDRFLVELRPRQLDHPVEPGPQHRVLGDRVSGMRSRRFSACLACSCASSGMPALSIASPSSFISSDRPASSPSSFWICLHLLAQQDLALALVDGATRLLFDLPLQLHHLDAV